VDSIGRLVSSAALLFKGGAEVRGDRLPNINPPLPAASFGGSEDSFEADETGSWPSIPGRSSLKDWFIFWLLIV